MIAARYHSVISSLSSCVPVLALSWHHKYKEVLKMFDLEKYCLESQDINNTLVENFFDFYENRELIKIKLQKHLPEVLSNVEKGALSLYQILNKNINKII